MLVRKGERLPPQKRADEQLSTEILSFCRHLAGSNKIVAAFACGSNPLRSPNTKATLEVLVVIHDFVPRFVNYAKILCKRNVLIIAVDEWVFERDVDRGFLGDALAGRMILPYFVLLNGDYLQRLEIKLKKRLILELMENLVLDFPELCYEIRMKPEYFMYEAVATRARMFPPANDLLIDFMREGNRSENAEITLSGYRSALAELETRGIVGIVDGYIRISDAFTDAVKGRKARFVSLFKTGQRTLFASLLSILPQVVDTLSQNRELLRVGKARSTIQVDKMTETPEDYLFVNTENGFVPLAARMGIELFAREVLKADNDGKIRVDELGGILNDVFLVTYCVGGKEKKVVAKRFRDWSGFKWFPLTLWSIGTRTFAVLARSRLEKEFAINQLLSSKGFAVPKILYISMSERLVFMEYVEGENVSNVIKRAVSRPAAEAVQNLDPIRKVGALFADVHSAGIALGDSKPENLVATKSGEIVMLDLEQASRGGDKVWDVAEFVYYAGHDMPLFAEVQRAELVAKAFIDGYLGAGGEAKVVNRAGNPKYTKVFSVFTLPHFMLAFSNLCRKAGTTERR